MKILLDTCDFLWLDRMLVCQALAHGLTLASSDPLIRQYPVTLL